MCSRTSSSRESSISGSSPRRYYTRSEARRCSTLDTGVSSGTNTNLVHVPSRSSRSSQSNDSPEQLAMDYTDTCPPPNAGCRNRKILIFLTAVVALGLVSLFIHNHFTEYHKTLGAVEASVCRIQTQIEQMKQKVTKGVKPQVVTIEKDTKVKLDTIENLLEDIKKSQKGVSGGSGGCPSKTDTETKSGCKSPLNKLIQKELELYQADKTGKIDFALESAGGSIVDTYDTVPYNSRYKAIFGIPLCYESNGPPAIIQTSSMPGECWAFKGSTGSVIIKLLGTVRISGVSLEHIPKRLSPSGEIDSAPQIFSIWGLKCKTDRKGVLLGQFAYCATGSPIQYFEIKEGSKSYRFIQLKIHSNHGNPHYTCVYRLRVHGTLDTDAIPDGEA